MTSPRIIGIEWATLTGKRPRSAGCNARLGVHGATIMLPIVRLTTDDGVNGFGYGRIKREQAAKLLGSGVESVFTPGFGAHQLWTSIEYALWDLIGHQTKQPVYALAAQYGGQIVPPTLNPSCYDTSLYFDDLDLESDTAAAERLVDEARDGLARGHRAFKLKVGRGARHMPLAAGTARDIAIIQAVREAIGTHAPLMIDANNGYNLNLTKHVLQETAGCHLYWLEEAFHEDPELYVDLKQWMAANGYPILIADGEGEASLHLLDWAREGLIDVVQYDIFGYGFTHWLQTARQLDAWGVRSAPHSYGNHYGNYAACHLAGAIRQFTFVEWDEAQTDGLDGSMYHIADGHVHVPDLPGFGLGLDTAIFTHAVEENGGALWV
jgi:L-rhamnonate dehydratase